MIPGIIIVSFSFLSLVLLTGWRVYAGRALTDKEISAGVASSEPFFREVRDSLFCFLKKKCDGFKNSKKPVWLEKIFCRFKNYCSRFSHYVNGRHSVEKNGCKGYWKEINGYKQDKTE